MRRFQSGAAVFRQCTGAHLILVAAALVVAICAPAGADDAVFYSCGKAYTLERSATEFAILLHAGANPSHVRTELETGGIGTLVARDGGRSRYRLLQVAATNTYTRDAAGGVPGIEWVRPVYRIAGGETRLLSTGQVVARVEPDVDDAQARDLFNGYGLRVVRPFDGLDHTYVLEPDSSPDDDEVALAADLYNDARVTYAHPNFALRPVARQISPQDEFFTLQWHLNNTGQGGGTPGADIRALDAWADTLGEDVRIGMFDDACDIEHEDLKSNYVIGQDVLDGDNDPSPGQVGDRHGTSVMGLICAAGNTAGVRGVAPNAQFTASRGVNGFATVAEMSSVYTFARQQNVDVHNNSWGFGAEIPTPDMLADAIRTAFEEGRDGRGMVILFATGNDGIEAPEDISALPTVIAVGSTNANDVRSSYSNYGFHLDMMAPSNPWDEAPSLPSMVTTDNTDDAGYAEPGYNYGGFDDFGLPDLENADYTKGFGGTSAACPVVTGVAALILSVNPDLTATQVRVVLEHTADQVSADDAAYDGVTSRSNTYGYGRVNAAAAVAAALESVDNGDLTWPDRVSDVRVTGGTLRWESGSETKNIVIVQSDDVFQWTPTDGTSYDVGQQVTEGVTVVFKDTEGEADSYEFELPDFGVVYFAIFAQNDLGRNSWGVLVNSDGEVTDAGPDASQDGGSDADGDSVIPINDEPSVTVDASPRSGGSPLEVTFQGNAMSDSVIVSYTWDFGDGSEPAEERNTTHIYEVTSGLTTTFTATLTVVDAEDDVGERKVAIVVSPGEGAADSSETGTVEITITDQNGAEVDLNQAPFTVQFTAETQDLPDDGVFHSVEWDFGDGSTANELNVEHAYASAGTWAVTVTVTTCHATNGCLTASNPAGSNWTTTSQVMITVGGTAQGIPPPPTSNGSSDGTATTNGSDDGTATTQDGNDMNGIFEFGQTETTTLSTGHNASRSICGVGLLPLWLGTFTVAAIRRWVR